MIPITPITLVVSAIMFLAVCLVLGGICGKFIFEKISGTAFFQKIFGKNKGKDNQ